jgi:poly-gamma-glutamate synthesis protein (capsule biosynthesis protein)
LVGLLTLVILSSCVAHSQTPTPQQPTKNNPTPTQVEQPTLTSTALPTSTQKVPTIWLWPDLPDALKSTFKLPNNLTQTNSQKEADFQITIGETHPISTWIFALAAPFPTVTDDITADELRTLWNKGSIQSEEIKEILVDSSTLASFEAIWGQPSSAVRTLPANKLLDEAWAKRTSWAIIPFEQLEPRWKVIAVDGQSPIQKAFDLNRYPLKITYSLTGDATQVNTLLEEYGPATPTPLLASTNRSLDKLTTVVLTGVTALVRGTAALMENKGMEYPATDLGPLLRDADILHISNEVPFAVNCPPPFDWVGLVFCSDPRYIALLDSIQPDVIELSGDHLSDWGPDAMLYTLQLYRDRGWKYYGGGANITEAEQPALFEQNGNKIAFIGCNYKDKGYATASASTPGAVHCDPSWLYPAIEQVKAEGYLPIVTFQDQEFYEFIADPKLQADFRGAADAGAVIVSGSQAHQPQAFEFDNGSLLHYGLGNLFFDQVYSFPNTDKAFIDRHIIYDGRYISTELITIKFVDYARARLMTPQERQSLLQAVFSASGW